MTHEKCSSRLLNVSTNPVDNFVSKLEELSCSP
jgi:hypothetical protein